MWLLSLLENTEALTLLMKIEANENLRSIRSRVSNTESTKLRKSIVTSLIILESEKVKNKIL
jgi:hypothetical protein